MKAKGKKADKNKVSATKKEEKTLVVEAKNEIKATEAVISNEVQAAELIEVLPKVMTSEVAPKVETQVSVAASVTPSITSEERQRLISLAAYYRAERKGFGKTNPVEDWLLAEREVDAMITREASL